MSTDTPLCAFVENQVICGYPQADTYGIHGPTARPDIHRHLFVPIPDSGVPEPDACHFRMPDGISCGKPRLWHRFASEIRGWGVGAVHGFVSAKEHARRERDPLAPTREYLVDALGHDPWDETSPSAPLLCTFRLAGGPCGLDSFDTVHRAHTDHPGFCGVYTCHEFRPEAHTRSRTADERGVLAMLVYANTRLTAAIEAYKARFLDDGR